MMQSRRMSLVEALTNVSLGFGVSFVANMIVLPAFGYPVTVKEGLSIGAIFTGIAVVRSYVIRRVFEALRVSPVEPKGEGV